MRLLAIFTVCVLAALLQVHLLGMASHDLGNNMGLWITQQGWPGYRSRIIGVGLIRLFGGDVRAFMEVTAVALTLAGLLAWRLGGAAGLGIFHACFAVFASPWFAPWDMFEPAVFLAFVVLVVEEMPWYWFVGLFSVAIFNLQSAMFVALWMVLSGRMFMAAIACLAFGIAVMWYFQHTGTPRLGLSTFQCLDGHTTGISTDYAQERLVENWHKLFLLDNRAPLGVIVVILFAAAKVARERLVLGLTFVALLGATVVFGIVDECRVWIPFIPLFIEAAK